MVLLASHLISVPEHDAVVSADLRCPQVSVKGAENIMYQMLVTRSKSFLSLTLLHLIARAFIGSYDCHD